MNERTHSLLAHMLEDATEALLFAKQAGSFAVFSTTPLFKKAIAMSIINIGELVKHLPDAYKEAHKHVPWRQIAGMRNIAAHGYHIMEDDIIWDVVTRSIPELIAFLQNALASEIQPQG